MVILALAFSLLECLWILPPHLAHMRPPQPSRYKWLRQLEAVRQLFVTGMSTFAGRVYRPVLERCLRVNLLVSALFLVALLVSLSLYGGGWLRSSFFPDITSDHVEAEITLQEGGPYADTLRILHQVEAAALQVKLEYNANPLHSAFGPAIGHIDSRGRENEVNVVVEIRSGCRR